MTQIPKFPIGTQYISGGKHGRLCTVIDHHVTTNSKGEFVKLRYVATHDFIGQMMTDTDIVETSVAMGIARLQERAKA